MVRCDPRDNVLFLLEPAEAALVANRLVDEAFTSQVAVASPLVAVDCRNWKNELLDNAGQRCRSPVLNNEESGLFCNPFRR